MDASSSFSLPFKILIVAYFYVELMSPERKSELKLQVVLIFIFVFSKHRELVEFLVAFIRFSRTWCKDKWYGVFISKYALIMYFFPFYVSVFVL